MKLDFEKMIKQAILEENQKVVDSKGNVFVMQEGTIKGTFDVWIIPASDPTKKYRFKEALKDQISARSALNNLKNLGRLPVLTGLEMMQHGSDTWASKDSSTIAPSKPGTKPGTKPAETPVKAPRPIPMPDPKNTMDCYK